MPDEVYVQRKALVDRLIARKQLTLTSQHRSVLLEDEQVYKYISWQAAFPNHRYKGSGISDNEEEMVHDVYVALEHAGIIAPEGSNEPIGWNENDRILASASPFHTEGPRREVSVTLCITVSAPAAYTDTEVADQVEFSLISDPYIRKVTKL